MQPETRYARSDEVNIAYQVVGSGALDLVYVMGWVSNLDEFWTEPSYARFLTRLASFTRLILFDKRGTGLSDRVHESELPTLEQRMDDVRAVMDAAGSEHAALLGISEGGPMCALFSATYPERTTALMMFGSYARRIKAPDYPWAPTTEEHQKFLDEIRTGWGGPVGLAGRAPSMTRDEGFRRWWTTYLIRSASPSAVLALTRMNAQTQTVVTGESVDLRKLRGRETMFAAADGDADDTFAAERDNLFQQRERGVVPDIPHQIHNPLHANV